MSGLNSICEKKVKRYKKHSSWGSLRPASVSCDNTSSDNNGKGKRRREYPQPSFTLRRITGPTSRCSYEIRQKLADFSVFLPGAGVFFAKKDPPGVNSKVGGRIFKKEKGSPGITQRFYAHFGQIWGGGGDSRGGAGGNSEDITVYEKAYLVAFIDTP